MRESKDNKDKTQLKTIKMYSDISKRKITIQETINENHEALSKLSIKEIFKKVQKTHGEALKRLDD